MKVEDVPIARKMGFLRKVYALLLAMISVTVAVTALAHYLPAFHTNIVRNISAYTWAAFAGVLVSLVLAIGVGGRKRRSKVIQGVLVGCVCASVSLMVAVGTVWVQGVVLLNSFLLAGALFVGLSVFTLQTKWDMRGLAPYLWGGMWLLMATLLVSFFLPYNNFWSGAVSIIILVVFSGFTIYDTDRIVKRSREDEWVSGALTLYLNFINIFLALVNLTSMGR